jgi:hypothetical protein
VPISHLLLGPTVAGLGQVTSALTDGLGLITVWKFVLAASGGLACAVVLLACFSLTRSWLSASTGTLVFALSGSAAYLGRVLEDNLVTTPWLAAVVLLLSPRRGLAPGPHRFALAGLALGGGMLYGFAAISWMLFLGTAAFVFADTWRARLGRFALSAGCCLLLFLGTATFVTPSWMPSPINPLTRFTDGVPNAGMFQTSHSGATRARYVLLGTYYAIYSLPAEVDKEWRSAYGQIAEGTHPGIRTHLLTVGGVIALVTALLWRRDRQDTNAAFALACAVTLACLTMLNLTAIDGSFPERFDHVPLLLAPIVALATADRRRPWVRRLTIAFVISVVATTLAYSARASKTGAALWSFTDARALTAVRLPAEPVIIDADVGLQYDMDPVSLNFGVWLGPRNTFLIPTVPAAYDGYYALRPRSSLVADEPRRAWFTALLREHDSVLMNDVAMQKARSVLDDLGWSLTLVHQGRFVYWRAQRRRGGS